MNLYFREGYIEIEKHRFIKMRNEMSKVSIIMPVCNAEKYLSEAIDSVLNQTYTEYELLLINDRSTDSSKDICQRYSNIDKRIACFDNNSDNHGPGPTRNIGLDHATGEYIYFMDADDWIDKSLLQCAVNRMRETKADIVQFGVIYERDDEKRSELYIWPGKDLLTKDEIKKDFFYYWKENRNSLWMHLFRREIVKTIRFENIIIGEDISYIMDALCNAEKIAYIAKDLYHYRYVEGSTSHHWVENTIECRGVIWKHQKKFLDSFAGKKDQLSYAEVAYDNYIWAIYQLCSRICPLPFRQKKKELSKLNILMNFDFYRGHYPLEMRQGLMRMKYTLVKMHFDDVLLLLGQVFLRMVRRE